jgi:hypothetical protein
VIPHWTGQHPDDGRHRFGRRLGRRCSAIEQLLGWLKECRHLNAQFEKLALLRARHTLWAEHWRPQPS